MQEELWVKLFITTEIQLYPPPLKIKGFGSAYCFLKEERALTHSKLIGAVFTAVFQESQECSIFLIKLGRPVTYS